jgi:hypothetical protein
LKKILLIPVLFFSLQANSQTAWKQSLRYDLRLSLNLPAKSLDVVMKLQYTNHSPDTLNYIWFHVWPNAYRNDRTLYSEQLLENGDTRFYFSSKDDKGYLNRLEFRVNGSMAVIQDHPEYIDVVKLMLPKPLLPGDSISISSSFHLKLPYNFNGNGFSAHHLEMRNWYPEPAVYDKNGWHPMPFLVQGGAYHEAADYDVQIEAPSVYRIAAGAIADTVSKSSVNNIYRYSLKNANAFAWIADSRYQVRTDSLQTVAGPGIRIQYFYSSPATGGTEKLFVVAKQELRQISEWLGPYAHQTISIIQAAPMEDQDFTGLVCIGAIPAKDDWQSELRKSLLSQWFQTMLMTNQRDQPWMSKGLIDYYNQRLANSHSPSLPPFTKNNLWLRVAENDKTGQPIQTAAPLLSTQNDSLIPGMKSAHWFALLRDSLGPDAFDHSVQRYFSIWQFGHPYPEDFRSVMDTQRVKNLQPVFNHLNENIPIFPDTIKRILKPAFIFSARNSEKYNYIGLAPIAGYNRYDGFMLGALIHNINLPENNFEFLFTPLYAFGSQTVEGLGRLSYAWRPAAHFSRIVVGINGGRFDTNKATDSTGNPLYENFSKLVPYIRFEFKAAGPRSTVKKWMDFKTYLITEKTFGQFAVSSEDSLIHPNSVSSNFRYVNQLSFNLQDDRALYPYGLCAEFQQSELFYRINLHADYFFNYPDGGGMKVRFFASKFGVWNNNNNADLSRYEPKLLGVDGNEDYLYEDYFIGRSASYALENTSVPNGGWPAQQIMNRDGGLKLRIDDYDYLQGKSANWVSALNFNTTLPANLFPFPLPIRIFFDLGTYAEAWQNNPPTSRFLYTGGIQLSLFRNLLNIYAPLFYSNDFNPALESTSFGKKITFSIDIQNINYHQLIRKAAEHD